MITPDEDEGDLAQSTEQGCLMKPCGRVVSPQLPDYRVKGSGKDATFLKIMFLFCCVCVIA